MICDIFNKHFASAGVKVKNSIPSTTKNPIDYVKQISDHLIISPVSEQYVCRVVANLKPKRSCGYDHISNVLLKNLISVIKLPVCIILNKSLLTGEFPELMKLAKVLPLHKSISKMQPDNYHPISLLPVISKILEKVVFDQLVAHLSKNSVLYPRQFGFRKKHSTSDVIMNLIGEVLKSFEEKFMLMSVFIDLKKAFDTVSHSVILNKLSKIGVNGKELEWFTNYITGRKQYVTMSNGVESSSSDISLGVQQGSLLRVLLFQLIINDLPNCLRYGTSILYADDTTLFVYGRSLKFMCVKLQHNLDNLQVWLHANSLKLNVSKTKVMLFNVEGLTLNVALYIDGQVIENVANFNFLGINLDNKLAFDVHFSVLYKRLLQGHFLIKKLSTILPRSCLRTLYFAYFNSHITYCLPVWYPLLNKKSQNAIYVVQKRVV